MTEGQVSEDSDYKVKFVLTKEVAEALRCAPEIYVNFDNSVDALNCLRHAQTGMHQMTLNLADGRKAQLRPKAWKSVSLITPRQIVVTPAPAKISGMN